MTKLFLPSLCDRGWTRTLTILFFSIPAAVAGQTGMDSVVRALARHESAYPQEKIYVQTDRPHYTPGDTLWFKAYLLDAQSHALDSISKNVYVDLVRPDKGTLVKGLFLENTGGFANGYIKLKDSLEEGVYELRAYTRWMRNFPEQYFFHKEIFLRKNGQTRQSHNKEEAASRLSVADLQFFPEGGNLIAGLQNRVAFKGVNKFGLGVNVKAFIISDHSDTVAAIQSQHLGMGSFILKPLPGKKYFAQLTPEAGGQKFELPAARGSGYSFFVDNLSNPQLIKVTARNNFTYKDRPFLIAHQRGNIIFAMKTINEGNAFSWALDKNQIRENGTIQLTLFDGNGVPQAERLIYANPSPGLKVSVSTDKTKYNPREKVDLVIKVVDADNQPVRGSFSLALTDSKQVNTQTKGMDIYNYFYLISDIQDLSSGVNGNVESPGYYFEPTNNNAVVHLDILLLTQGWRRFTWAEVLASGSRGDKYELETSFTVKGTALMESGKVSSKPVTVTMMYISENGESIAANTTTNAQGRFAFTNISIQQGSKIYIQAVRKKSDRYINLTLDKDDPQVINQSTQKVDPFFIDQEGFTAWQEEQSHIAELEQKLSLSKTKVLKEVTVSATREKQTDTRKSAYSGTNMTSLPITQQMCSGVNNLLQMLQGRVAGLSVSLGSSGNYTAYLTRYPGNVEPAILVDGNLTPMNFVASMSACNVESIDVITHPVLSVSPGNRGVISILTKRANPDYDWSKESVPGTIVTTIRSYDQGRVFYSPIYKTSQTDAVPDFRATLYWNPKIVTDSEGNAHVTFYNSDEQTTVHVNFEGVSLQGIPAVGTTQYNIGE